MKARLTLYFAVLITAVFSSCNEQKFLEEVPLDFYSPENSYVTLNDFNAAIYHLHANFRTEFYDQSSVMSAPRIFQHGTDFCISQEGLGLKPNYAAFTVPTSEHIYDDVWRPAYNLIYDANVILERSNGPYSRLTDSEAGPIRAEAMFFRGYAYKMLANLYGGVPIVLEEVKSPKRDYVRATRDEVYRQAAEDLTFAAENLPDIDEVPGGIHINRLAAYHVLSEVYISLREWDKAIEAASVVIRHPNMKLMTERFGTRVSDPIGGDFYWDLFRKGNQNRSSGNKEAIWVQQWEYNVPGGGSSGGPKWIRFYVPRLWQAGIANSNGTPFPVVMSPNTYWHGRGGGFMRQNNYFYYTIWQKSGWNEDIRNSKYNMIRDIQVNNPNSEYDGKWVIKDHLPLARKAATDTLRNWFPAISGKATDPGGHPKAIWLDEYGSLPSSAESYTTYRDEYTIRLAETYLLRAEAYLGKGDLQKAAGDINVVRARAEAPLARADEIDIDYILDERLRELHIEEFRLLTLTRLGKLVERARKYNDLGGNTWQDHHNLWPIPYSEIEKNIEGKLEQNPGY